MAMRTLGHLRHCEGIEVKQEAGRYYVNVRVLDTDVIVLIEVLVVVSISPIHKKFFAFRMYLRLLNGPIIANVKTIMLAAWLKSQGVG